jgi:hypothetical protein
MKSWMRKKIERENREKVEGKRHKIPKKKRGKEDGEKDGEKPKIPKLVWGISRGLGRYFKVAPEGRELYLSTSLGVPMVALQC